MNILMRSISTYSRKWEATTQSSDGQWRSSTANKILVVSVSIFSFAWTSIFVFQKCLHGTIRWPSNRTVNILKGRITKFSCKWKAITRSDRKGNVLLCNNILAVSVSILMHLLFFPAIFSVKVVYWMRFREPGFTKIRKRSLICHSDTAQVNNIDSQGLKENTLFQLMSSLIIWKRW